MNTTSTNPFCEFTTIDNINFECKNCGLKISTMEGIPPFLPCRKLLSRTENQSEPSFAEKIMNFANATIGHIKEGMPQCTQEQIIERHNICVGCEFFKDDTCSKCGCPLIRNKQFVSKLAWADQECPVGKWGKLVN